MLFWLEPGFYLLSLIFESTRSCSMWQNDEWMMEWFKLVFQLYLMAHILLRIKQKVINYVFKTGSYLQWLCHYHYRPNTIIKSSHFYSSMDLLGAWKHKKQWLLGTKSHLDAQFQMQCLQCHCAVGQTTSWTLTKLDQSHNLTWQPNMWTRPKGQLTVSSHMPAGQRRAASDGDIVLDTRHSAVIRRIAHFGPCPQGICQGTAGPAERGTSWFILSKGHRERGQGKSHTAEKT